MQRFNTSKLKPGNKPAPENQEERMSESKQTLLDKAKLVPANSRYSRAISQEEIDLAVAWARDEVSYKQITHAINRESGSLVSWLLTRLKAHIRNTDAKGKP